MTPAAIALAVLCAVLAVVVAWQRGTLRNAERRAAVLSDLADERHGLRKQVATDSALLWRAFSLLKDERSNCRTVRRESWKTEIAELENDWRKG